MVGTTSSMAVVAPLARHEAQERSDDHEAAAVHCVTPTGVLLRPWTVEELATACNVSQALVRKCIKAGTLSVHRLGRLVRIAEPEALRFAGQLGAVLDSSAHQAHGAHGAHTAHRLTLTLAHK